MKKNTIRQLGFVRQFLLGLVFIFFIALFPASGKNAVFAASLPVGYFDNAGCDVMTGWTCDADDYSKALSVDFYADGLAGQGGVYIGSATAGNAREQGVTNSCGGKPNHGFSFTTPINIKDGKTHTIYTYAINTPSGTNPLLQTNGKKITCCPNGQISIQFLGTGYPNHESWSTYGRQLASALVNNDMVVDFSCFTEVSGNTGTCAVARLRQYGVDLNGITSILITHHHEDHFQPAQIVALARARTSATKLTLYSGITVVNQMNSYLASINQTGLINVVHLAPYVQAAVGPYAVTPLIANHDIPANEPYVYIIQSNGKQFLYGTDSGILAGTSLEKIYATKFDLIIRERTFDSYPASADRSHMDANAVATERADWIAHGVITSTTPYNLTHIAYCAVGHCVVPAGTADLGDGAKFYVCLGSSSCTNDCPYSGATQCSGTGGFQTCGNYDSDSCLEWSGVATCPSGQSCSNGVCSNACTPKTCLSLGYNCGSAPDGCGGNLSCGTCTSGVCYNGTCQTNYSPIGNFDVADCTSFRGWTCDQNDYGKALDVHFYANGSAAGGGTLAGVTNANLVREAAVGSRCGGNASHGFSFPTPASLKDGKSHVIYAYSINIPTGTNPQLTGDPKTITCAASQTAGFSDILSRIQANISRLFQAVFTYGD